MTGVGLGLSASVKWVGLFIIAAIGVSTIHNLWNLIDSQITLARFSRHFMARAFALIAVPIAVYMAIFQVRGVSRFPMRVIANLPAQYV